MIKNLSEMAPGPWGIKELDNGVYEVNFGDVVKLDQTGKTTKVTFSNGEKLELPDEVKVIKAINIEKVSM